MESRNVQGIGHAQSNKFLMLQEFRKIVMSVRYKIARQPELGALIAFLFVFGGFSIAAKGFLSLATAAGVLTVIAELGIVSIGIALLIISGEFDLSVGSILAVSSMSCAILLRSGVGDLLACAAALVFACTLGFLNGVIVVRARIPSFITTLGTMMLWRGILLAISGGLPTVPFFGESVVFNLLNSRLKADFRSSAFWFTAVALIAQFVLRHTKYGNWIYATGGNKEAARALGVPILRVKLINFILSGFLAGLAGLIQLARFRTVDALRGQGMELEAIAAAVTGGVSLKGGYGTILGAVLGVFIIGMVRTGLLLAKAPPYWYQAFVGIILIIAVIINVQAKGGGVD